MRRALLPLVLVLAGCGSMPALTAQGEAPVQARLEPASTQAKADKKAGRWAPDARQVGVGWAFYKNPILGGTTHVYHSKAKKQVFIVAFAGTSWVSKERVDADPNHARIAWLLGAVRPGVPAKQAFQAAQAAGLSQRDVSIGALIRPPIPRVPGIWTFHVTQPEVFVNAENGKPLMSLASEMDRYLVPEWFDPQQ